MGGGLPAEGKEGRRLHTGRPGCRPHLLAGERACLTPHPHELTCSKSWAESARLGSLAKEGRGVWSPRLIPRGGSEGTPTYKKELVGEVEVARVGKEGGAYVCD